MNKPLNDNPPGIPDSTIFACQDAAAEEMSRWVLWDQHDGSILCVRNRLSPGDLRRMDEKVQKREPLDDKMTIETMRFKDKSYAKSFLGWRGVKAALEEYDRLRKPSKEIIIP
jgi:hypothetical protein